MESNNRKRPEIEDENSSVEKVIKIDRINKVVKGGKRLAFRAFVISGDAGGMVGFSLGKSKEVPSAIRKAVEKAKKAQTRVEIIEGTLPHEVEGRFGAARVILKPARPGTGVIAGGAVRILLEAAGYHNVVAKALGSRNPINMTKAAMNALLKCRIKAVEEKRRGRTLSISTYAKG